MQLNPITQLSEGTQYNYIFLVPAEQQTQGVVASNYGITVHHYTLEHEEVPLATQTVHKI